MSQNIRILPNANIFSNFSTSWIQRTNIFANSISLAKLTINKTRKPSRRAGTKKFSLESFDLPSVVKKVGKTLLPLSVRAKFHIFLFCQAKKVLQMKNCFTFRDYESSSSTAFSISETTEGPHTKTFSSDIISLSHLVPAHTVKKHRISKNLIEDIFEHF